DIQDSYQRRKCELIFLKLGSYLSTEPDYIRGGNKQLQAYDMSNYLTTFITATSPPSSHRMSTPSLISSDGSSIIITATVTTTVSYFPAPVPPPFAPSLGSDETLPQPKRGAPPVRPATDVRRKKAGLAKKLRRAVGLERRRMDPALCEDW
ncbi:hypothetical protein C8J57DRAFT_135257, partial [Mycena rebaudengoi]